MATSIAPEEANALLRAAYEGNTELMLKLLSDGIPVDVANQGGLQAVHFAAKAGRVDVMDDLLQHGASVDAKSTKGNTPLHVASLLGRSEVVKLLLRRGADVNAVADCNDDEFTPLYMAAQVGHQVIVTLLLAQGADPTLPTKNGCTPCDVALQQGHKVVSELLAEYEKRMNGEGPPDEDGAPPGEDKTPPGEDGATPTKDDDQNEAASDAIKAEDQSGDVLTELAPDGQMVKLRKHVARKSRPKSGPPPVCEEPIIPSPKPSPLKTNNKEEKPAP